jgi:tripartite-type tricarboxylate transporter receptor subunit TctC
MRPSLSARLALGLASIAAVAAAVAPVSAQTYPSRPVTIITPFAAGSVTDATARTIAQHLQDTLGQPFVVENRAGAGGLLAANAVARANPDGYTLLITTNSTHSAAPGLFKTVPYDPIKDFTPVARIGSFPSLIAVHPSLPMRSMQDFVAYAKANPGKLSYAHGNSTGHITGEALKQRTGIDVVRVAYRSNPAAMTDLIAGHIPAMVPDFGTALPQLKAQTIRGLAVITKQRSATLPDMPTLHETVVPDFDLLAWAGMFAPANLPAPIANRIAGELQTMLSKPDVKERFINVGVEVFYSGPREFEDYVKSELVKWTGLIKEVGIQPE